MAIGFLDDPILGTLWEVLYDPLNSLTLDISHTPCSLWHNAEMKGLVWSDSKWNPQSVRLAPSPTTQASLKGRPRIFVARLLRLSFQRTICFICIYRWVAVSLELALESTEHPFDGMPVHLRALTNSNYCSNSLLHVSAFKPHSI